MKFLTSLLLTFLSISICKAQDNYDADLIPAELKNRANAVVRNQETVVDMQAPNNVIYTVKQAITILNKNGEENARLVLFYDKNTSIKSIKGEIYNEFGKLTDKFTHSDFRDESAVSGFSLFEDSRVKHHLPLVNVFPYTVVYNYEIRFKQNLMIPEWAPKPISDVSVEKSSYTFICKPSDKFRIKTENINSKPTESSNEKQKTIIWKLVNLTSSKVEPYSPNKTTYLPSIKIAPQNFTYYNYKGSFTNWEELGKWYYNDMLKGRNTLPNATIQIIKDLVKDETTDKGKAKKIYEYLQNKTRYISVQIGIGGFQPFTADEVDRLGYGDCKALVNYMQSLLSVVGIESYYCIVQAGSEKISLDPNYASMEQGNHVILYLPLDGDSVWLECTSQKAPFGFLGDFTDDRLVLACTPEGGKLIKTPKLTTANNLQIRYADLIIANDGNVTGKVTTTFSGSQYDNHEEVIGKPFMDQQKLLKEAYDIDHINFDNIDYQKINDIDPKIVEDLNLQVKNYGAINNDRMFLTLNLFNIRSLIPDVKNRVLPVYLNRGYTDIDSITYHLPTNFEGTIEPFDKNYSCTAGSYVVSAKQVDQKLIYTRRLVINEGTFPKETYQVFSKFISDVNSTDHQKVILSLKK